MDGFTGSCHIPTIIISTNLNSFINIFKIQLYMYSIHLFIYVNISSFFFSFVGWLVWLLSVGWCISLYIMDLCLFVFMFNSIHRWNQTKYIFSYVFFFSFKKENNHTNAIFFMLIENRMSPSPPKKPQTFPYIRNAKNNLFFCSFFF